MDDHKMKEKMEEVKSKAKAFMKTIGSSFGSSRSTETFKGQGHRLGGSAGPSFSSPSPHHTPTPRCADGNRAGHSNSGGAGAGGCGGKKLGSGYNQQKQEQSDLRRLQQEKWERDRGIAPVQASRQCRGTVSPTSAHTLRAKEHVLHSGGTLASAAASVTSPTPDDSLRVERESIGTVQVGNMAANYSPLNRSGLESTSHFDPYSPIIASGTSHRPSIGTQRVTETKGQFQCPICQKWWQSEAQVSAHIDDCTGVGNPDIASLSLGQDGTSQKDRQWENEQSVPVDLDDAVAIFLSGGPSSSTIEVILKLFRNILNDPSEEKFWTLRMGNKTIKETIGKAIGGLTFLESVGFRSVEGGEKVSLIEKPSIERLEQIQAAIAYLESYNSANEAPVMTSQPSHAVPNNLNPVNRQLRIFYASKDHLEERFEVPDSFYHLSAAELKNEAAARRKKLEDSQLLIPKSFREKQAAIAKRRYKLTVVRVQLPDGLVIQGFFNPEEPTSALYEFVASILKDGHETFDLVLPAATKRRVIPCFPEANGRCLTMEEADLVPKALLKFNPTGPHGYTCLKNEYYALCEPLTLTTLLEPHDLHKN